MSGNFAGMSPDPWGCSKSLCKKKVRAHFSFLNTLTTHTPLIRKVEVHPLIKGVGLKKSTVKTRGFGQPTPLIKGVNLHLLN